MTITKNNIHDVYRAKKCGIDTMQKKGYTLLKNIMVDNSRMGKPDEMAHTPTQFENELLDIFKTHTKITAKITDVGQFQVYIGLFIKTHKNQQRK